MKNYFQNDPEAFEEGLAELKIYVDNQGEITFNDFYKIVETIKFFIVNREKELQERKNDDSLVVNPRDITR